MMMKNLNGTELSDMLSTLSPTARANMLKLRFASIIAKANPQMEVIDLHHTKQQQQQQKISAQLNKRKRREQVLLQGRTTTSEVRQPTAAADHKKQKIAAAGCKAEEPRPLSWKCKASLPQPPEDHRRTSNSEEEKKKTTSLSSSTPELQKEELNLKKKIIARREQINSERKAFRLKLLQLERSVDDIEDNLKVMRDFERLGNDPWGSNFFEFEFVR